MDSRDSYIAQLEQQNKELLKQVSALSEQIVSLNRQIENLTEVILQMRRDKFGPSSEKTARNELDGQLHIRYSTRSKPKSMKPKRSPAKSPARARSVPKAREPARS